MSEEITSIQKLDKVLRKRGKYLTVNINETEALSLGIKEGEIIRIEKIVQLAASELVDKPYDDLHTYND